MRRAHPRVISALGVLAFATPSAAQQIIIMPQLGAFVPLRDQSQWSWTDCCINGGDFTETLRSDLLAAPSLGLKIGIGWGGWLGVEASVATTSTERQNTWSASEIPNPPPEESLAAASRVTITSLRVRFRKFVATGADVSVSVGPSLVSQSQEAFCGSQAGSLTACIQDLTTFGATFDIALGLTMTPRVRFELALVDNIYSVQYPEPPFPGTVVDPDQSSFRQHDMMIFAGFAFVLKQ
jgi:hypothetical protein